MPDLQPVVDPSAAARSPDLQVAPVAPIALQPSAQPNRLRFTTPALPQDVGRDDLVKGLSQFDAGLSSFVDERMAKQSQADALQGEADFYRNNSKGFAQGVADGSIPASASPAYVNSYKAAQGQLAGDQMQEQFKAAYAAWPGKADLNDPSAYDNFAKQWVSQNIGTNDPAVLAGLMPKLHQMVTEGFQQHITDQDRIVKDGLSTTESALVASDIGTAVAAVSNGSADASAMPGWIANRVGASYQKQVALGLSPAVARANAIEQIAGSALLNKGDHGTEIIQALDMPLGPGGLVLSQTPEGMAKKVEVTNAITAYQKQSQLEQSKYEAEANKADIEDATDKVQQILAANPKAVIPQDLIDQATWAGDGAFRSKIAGWSDTFAKQGATSDPAELRQMRLDIMDGGGQAVIRSGVERGVLNSGKDFAELTQMVKDYASAGPVLSDLMQSETFKQGMEAIKTKTGTANKDNPFAPVGISTLGMNLQYELKHQMIQWAAANPNATYAQAQDQLDKTIAGVMKYVTTPANGLEPATGVNPPGSPFGTSEGAPAVSSAVDTRTGGDTQGGVVPPTGQPQGMPAASGKPAAPMDRQGAIQQWIDGLPPEQMAMLAKESMRSGKPAADIAALAYDKQVAAGVIKPPQSALAAGGSGNFGGLVPVTAGGAGSSTQPMPKRQVMGGDGSVIRTDAQGNALNPDGTPTTTAQPAAPVAPVTGDTSGFESAVRKWAATDPDAAAKVHQFTALVAGIHDSLPYQGSMTVAALKNNPQASHLLDFVAGPESKGNYNAYYGHGDSQTDLSKMSLNQVLTFQHNLTHVQGLASSATGRYQFMPDTLRGLMAQLHLTGNEKFTPEMQDNLALQLLKNRGLEQWQKGGITDSQFANNLAAEWASLPVMQTGRSHYAGDGLNKALVTPRQVATVLGAAKRMPGQSAEVASGDDGEEQ